MTALSSPVSRGYLRCWDNTGATCTESNLDPNSMLEDSSCLAAFKIVCKICRVSPWLTTKIAHLKMIEHRLSISKHSSSIY